MTVSLTDLETKVRSGHALSRDDGARVLACPDLLSVGMLGEMARKALHGDRITFGRVVEISAGQTVFDRGEAGEVRLTGMPASIEEARTRVREAARSAQGVPLTGFSVADLLNLAGGDHLVLADLASALKHEGLEAVAEVPLDGLGDAEDTVEIIRALGHGGLAAWRATVETRWAVVRLPTRAFRIRCRLHT